MKSKFLIAVGIVLGAMLITPGSNAQIKQTSNELYKLCSKFPNNSKCKGIEVPIPLEERSGEKVDCNFIFDPGEFNQAGGCKIVLNEEGITIYQEQGDKIELLEDQRASVEVKIPRDRIFITNYQLWNKVHRWEVGFLPEESSQKRHQTNFMVVFMKEDVAESLAAEIDTLSSSEPEKVTEVLANQGEQPPIMTVLVATKVCEYCDLSGVNLSGLDLEGANLVGANLQGANLVGANLVGAYLLGANLEGADLTAADFTGANLTFGNLHRATLISTDFEGANFQQANLSQTNLTDADLTAPAFLQQANLSKANLTEANLGGANLEQANLQGADLRGANLGKIDVKLKNIPNNYSFGEQLADQITIVNLLGVTSRGVDFFTNLTNANLEGANLSSTNLKKIVFKGANLTNVNFTESNLKEEDLEEAKVCGVTLADGSKSDRDCPKPDANLDQAQ